MSGEGLLMSVYEMSSAETVLVGFGDPSWLANVAVAGRGFTCLCGEGRGEGRLFGEDFLVGLARHGLR